jgi:hypothetical protein
MPIAEASSDDGQLYTHVDDEQYDELSELNGQQVVHVAVWEEGLADAMTAPQLEPTTEPTTEPSTDSPNRKSAPSGEETAADIDLYLADGVYFELYGTVCYTDLDAQPLASLAQIEQRLQRLVKAGVELEEIAVDEDDGLVLILAQNHQPVLYLQVGAWLLDEWEELPESTTS